MGEWLLAEVGNGSVVMEMGEWGLLDPAGC